MMPELTYLVLLTGLSLVQGAASQLPKLSCHLCRRPRLALSPPKWPSETAGSVSVRSRATWTFQKEPFYREQSAKPGRAMHFHASPSVTTTASVFSNREFTGRGSLRSVRDRKSV